MARDKMISTEMRRSFAGFALLAGLGLLAVPAAAQTPAMPASAGEKTDGPRDSRMRRIVAEFEGSAAGATRQFRSELAALARCGKECEPAGFAKKLAKSAAASEQTLTAALKTADKQLKERAGALGGADAVLGAAGDLSRAVASLEFASERVSAEMTESLTALKGVGFGGQPLLTTLQFRLASLESLVTITPITLRTILTVHVDGSPTAYVSIDGRAQADFPVTVSITCGATHQLLQTAADDDGGWGVSASVMLPPSKTCAATASSTGFGTGIITFEIHFP